MRDGKRGRIAKRISGERPLRRRPIFVFLAVVSVALRRVLVRGGEAAALVSRPFKVQFTSNWCSQKIPIFIGIFALYSITYFNLFADRLK